MRTSGTRALSEVVAGLPLRRIRLLWRFPPGYSGRLNGHLVVSGSRRGFRSGLARGSERTAASGVYYMRWELLKGLGADCLYGLRRCPRTRTGLRLTEGGVNEVGVTSVPVLGYDGVVALRGAVLLTLPIIARSTSWSE